MSQLCQRDLVEELLQNKERPAFGPSLELSRPLWACLDTDFLLNETKHLKHCHSSMRIEEDSVVVEMLLINSQLKGSVFEPRCLRRHLTPKSALMTCIYC